MIKNSARLLFSLVILFSQYSSANEQLWDEWYRTLKQQSEMFIHTKDDGSKARADVLNLIGKLDTKIQDKSQEAKMLKSPAGRRLLEFSRRFKAVRVMMNQLEKCAKSQKSQGVLAETGNAWLSDAMHCEQLLNSGQFQNLLRTASAMDNYLKQDQKKMSAEFRDQMMMENLKSAAKKIAQIKYLVTDGGIKQSFGDSVCGHSGWCDSLVKNTPGMTRQKLESLLNNEIQQEIARLKKNPNLKPRKVQEIAKTSQCLLVGCGSQKGIIRRLSHDFDYSQSSFTSGISLEPLAANKKTDLKLTQYPVTKNIYNRDELIATANQRAEWTESVKTQAQALAEVPMGRLQTDPVLQILGGMKIYRSTFCLGGCTPVIGSTSDGRPTLRFSSPDGPSFASPLISQMMSDPEAVIRNGLNKVQENLTKGLERIGKDLYSKTPSADQLNVQNARLLQGNPLAAGRVVFDDPKYLASVCEGLKDIKDDNPWIEALHVVGGVVVLGGGYLLAGPPGLAVAGGALGLFEAGVSLHEAQGSQRMAHLYQMSCLTEVSPGSCEKYQAESLEAQTKLLSAALNVATIGGVGSYRSIATRALNSGMDITASFKFADRFKATLLSLPKSLDKKLLEQVSERLSQASPAETERTLAVLERLKSVLDPKKMDTVLKRALAKGCTVR